MKFVFLAVLIIFVSGCGFVGYGGIGEAVYTSASTSNYEYLKKTNNTGKSDLERIAENLKRQREHKPKSVSDIENEWGKPDKIVAENDKIKNITYNEGLRWKGIILIIGVPIPLAIPVGHKSITFNIENDKLNNWTIHDDHYCASYAGFNLIPIDPEGKSLGLISETSCEWHKDMTPYEGKMACTVPFYDRCYSSPEYGRGENLK